MAEWFFRKKSKGEVERDPGWDEYFTSNRSTDESLVREAIQNSLDAHAKVDDLWEKQQPARVRFFYSGTTKALAKDAYAKYLVGAAEHYAAEDCKIGVLPDGDCPYVAIEDFNTTGLTGHPDWDYTNIKKKPPYYRFFWSENQSEKGEGTRGKWGIGKVVFPIASRLRSFFAYSIRNEEPRELLCGKALLSYHTVNGQRYSADGWWGLQNKGEGVPETDAAVLSAFKADFNLQRTNEPGLSVVVPFVKALDWDSLKLVLVENYMVSFVRGELQVELENGDGDKAVFDAEHLNDIEAFLVALVARDPSARMQLEAFRMVRESAAAPVEFRLQLYDGERPEWQPKMFPADTLEAMRDELDKPDVDGLGKPITVVVPMRLAKKEGKHDKLGEFKVVMRRSSAFTCRPWFYREGLFINRVKPNAVANFIAVVLVDGAVSDMLNQAEPPSHSEWRVNTGNFAQIYKYPTEHIEYIVRSVLRIVSQVDDTEKGLDYNALKSIFFVSREQALASARRGKGAGAGNGTGGAKDPPPEKGGATGDDEQPDFDAFEAKPKPYVLYPTKDGTDSGVTIKVNEKAFKPFELKVSFFYETLSGKVKFDENDFSFLRKGSLSVSWEPGDVAVEFPAANRLRVRVTEAQKDFKLTVRGFDANRDLRVIPYSEDLKEADDGAEL